MYDVVTDVWLVGLMVSFLLLLMLVDLVAKLFQQLLELLQINCKLKVYTMHIYMYHTYIYIHS